MNINFKHVILAAVLAGTVHLAQAEVVVIVSAKSGVGSLTADQVAQIFLGKTHTFPSGGEAVPVNQKEGSANYTEFHSKVVGKDAAQVTAYWSKQVFTGMGKPPKEVAGTPDAKKLIADNPNLIGYIDKGAVDSSVKVVLAP